MEKIIKRPKTELGSLEMRLLAYVQMRKMDVVRTEEIAAALKITPKQERELLSRMSRSGVIIRLKRGIYLVPPRLPAGGRLSVSEYYILSRLMREVGGKYQVSGPNTFYLYGFDNQVPNRVYVYNNRISGEKNIGGFDYVFMKIPGSWLGASTESAAPDGEKFFIATKARALLDAVYDWSRYNTIPRAYQWIATAIKKDTSFLDEFTRASLKYGNKATMRRIGYLLAVSGVPENMLREFKKKAGSMKSLIKWIPGMPAKGSVNKEWGLIVNGNIETG
jgi:predicted transcriptional regulator of viral defense system